ncbi:MAG: MlaD family protein [Planctomycetota bacterium]|jgi:phospholipid/cholesterol/gamma-HCH transport system substrate-binding protein
MKRNTRRHVNLGIFLIGSLTLLVVLSLYLTNVGLNRVAWTAYFGDAFRVKAGSEVFTSGMKVGVVSEVDLVPPAEMTEGRHVRVVLQIREDLVLWEGAAVYLTTRGLLGRSVLELQRGDPGKKQLRPETSLPGRITPGLFEDLAGLVADSRDNITQITTGLAAVTERLRKGEGSAGRFFGPDDALYQKVEAIVEDVAEITSAAKSRENSFGRLLTDRGEVFDRVLDSIKSFQEVGAKIRSGEGPLGRLVYDDEIARDLKETVTRVRDRVRAIDKGEGSLGKLIVDDTLHDTLLEGVGALRDFAVRVQEGKGTFTRLLDDDGAIYENFRLFSEDLASVSADVRAGKGTLGKLLVDEGIYEELYTMLQTFRETGDVARENAPLTSLISFSSLFFNVLN